MQNHFLITLAVSLLVSLSVVGQTNSTNGHLTIKKVARNAVRIQYQDKTVKDTLPKMTRTIPSLSKTAKATRCFTLPVTNCLAEELP